jgi:hypothetical protein
MGGNALKHLGINTKRVDNQEYKALIQELKFLLCKKEDSPFSKFEEVLCYKSKKDHGDIDFIALANKDSDGANNEGWAQKTKDIIKPTAFQKEHKTLSLDFKNVQIDITAHKEGTLFKANLDYCNYSPLGNILGRMLKQIGVKWGIDGLSYPIRKKENPSQVLDTVLLSQDIEEILNFAGLDEKIWEKGFEDLEEIFLFATKCPFFNKESFALENLDSINRKRDKKRKDYQAWGDFLKEKEPQDLFPYTNPLDYSSFAMKEREAWKETINAYFPHAELLEKERLAIEKEKERVEDNKKLNGKIISTLTGLQGNELGETIKEFKKEINLIEPYENWLHKVNAQLAQEGFRKFYKKFKNKEKHRKTLNLPSDIEIEGI